MKLKGNFFGYPVYHMNNQERVDYFTGRPMIMVAFADPINKFIVVFDEFYHLHPGKRQFILLHEIGHIQCYPNMTEKAANEWAISHIEGDRSEIEAVMQELYNATDRMRAQIRKDLEQIGSITLDNGGRRRRQPL